MNEQERAEEHLKTIRRLMERATIYRAISAPTALVGGVLSVVACTVYLKWFSDIYPPGKSFGNYFLWIWLLVLFLTVGANMLFIVTSAKKRGEPVFSSSMKAAVTALAPAFIAGGTFTLALAGKNGNPVFVLSVLWPLCYGLGLLATNHFAPRSLMLLGWAFLLSGVLGLLLTRLPASFVHTKVSIEDYYKFGALFMAATFGLFHLIYAACAWPRKGATPEA